MQDCCIILKLATFRLSSLPCCASNLSATGYIVLPILHRYCARIHAVHHNDMEMDATTSLRRHPLEHVISTLVFVPTLMALGPNPLVLLGYNVLHAAVSALNHDNFSLEKSADRVLRLFIVTPYFHRVHHSSEQRYTDSNCAFILPMFDYLFRSATKCTAEQQKTMPFGLTYFYERKYSRLDQLLLMPFQPKFASQSSKLVEPAISYDSEDCA